MKNSILHSLHADRGARLRPSDEPSPLLTYGDVPAEYDAATEGCALFDETDRGAVAVSGADAADFLHRVTSNDVNGLAPGQGNAGLLLTNKGKVRACFDVARDADGGLLSTEPGRAPALVEALDQYLFGEQVELRDATADTAPLCLVGPETARVLERALEVTAPAEHHATVLTSFAGGPVRLTTLPRYGCRGVRIDGGGESAAALWQRLVEAGARPAGRVVADILRVEAGVPQPGEDIDEGIYPQEARLEAAFSLDKGCYTGQEVVAKISTYGGINKRLSILSVSHDDPLPPGTELFRFDEKQGEWRKLGLVTSWAYSFVLDTGLVLAYVKRRHQAAGTVFRLGEGPAEAVLCEMPVRPSALAVTGDFE